MKEWRNTPARSMRIATSAEAQKNHLRNLEEIMKLHKCRDLFTATRVATLLFALAAVTPLASRAGNFLYHVESISNSQYIATAQLSIYDMNNVLIDQQSVRAENLFISGTNTGTSILFDGTLSFPDPFPLTPGGSGGATVTLHDFEVDLATLYTPIDTVHAQIDWFGNTYLFTHDWSMAHADDFENGIAYYSYGEFYYPGPTGELLSNGYYANLGMTFASGVAPVPVPAAIWLFGSGLLGLLAVSRKRRH
jgi:hypothetical protein